MKHLARKETWIRLLFLSLFLLLLFNLAGPQTVLAQDGGETTITIFWGDGCPHCAKAKPFLADLQKRYDNVKIVDYEIWYNDANKVLFDRTANALGVPAQGRGVPLIIVGDQYWMGFSDSIGSEIESVVKDNSSKVVDSAQTGSPVSPNSKEVLDIPLIGKIDLAGKSLFVSTILISFVDGFNPCSVWVLTMLLALTLHTGSRRKVLIIGLIFLTVTAGIYALFIAGLFATLNIARFTGWIQVIVALVALFFAAVNIKDYFWYKEGVSFTIADESKPGIFQKVRRVMDASDNFWSMAGATVVLSAGVSLVEFSCTVGLPMMWANILTSQKVAAGMFAVLLLIYLIIYQLDEMAIFFTAVYTMKATKLEEKHGRILKLISGVLMLVLAVVMLVNPQLLNDLSSSLLVFLAAFALVVLVLVVHRRILPAYGIWIGSEDTGKRKGAKRRAIRKPAR